MPGSLYDPKGHNLLSPQHWARHTGDGRNSGGSGTTTTAMMLLLFWNNRQYQRTIELTPYSNVADLQLAPGYGNYQAFKTEIGDIENDDDMVGDEYGSVMEDSDKLEPNSKTLNIMLNYIPWKPY